MRLETSAFRALRTAMVPRSTAFVCASCRGQLRQSRTSPASALRDAVTRRAAIGPMQRRGLVHTALRRQEERRESIPEPKEPDNHISPPPRQQADATGNLLSSSAPHRNQLSERLSALTDILLARASVAGQHINAYTGTDYRGIETLRQDIAAQEGVVRAAIGAAEQAKTRHREAHATQTGAQREIVGLLERKSSWAPADLERYMALVRQEHVHDREVQAAREHLDVVERELDDARAGLEKLERKRYHEEQIWSDTIRRNSTWVTFGLMGVNIVLLLAQITVFEPYRRKKIVHDVKAALDEKTIAHPAAALEVKDAGVQAQQAAPTEEKTKLPAAQTPVDEVVPAAAETTAPPDSAVSSLASDTSAAGSPASERPVFRSAPNSFGMLVDTEALRAKLDRLEEVERDQFSERSVQLRKVDVTTTALVGAAAGAVLTGILSALLRS